MSIKRIHCKSCQNDQYKVAEKRIKILIGIAWLTWILPDLNMKFDYEV